MARNQASAPHELDPLKGGLKHHPFAALREKLESTDARAELSPDGEQREHVAHAPNEVREVRTPSTREASISGAGSQSPTVGRGNGSTSSRPSVASNPRERVTVRIERTGRGGKTVTIAEGPAFAGLPLDALARDIARGMGTGAHAKSEAIIVQGDQRERLVTWLGDRGFPGAVTGN